MLKFLGTAKHTLSTTDADEVVPLSGGLEGVKPLGRSAVDPSRTNCFCSVTVSCGRETIDLRRGTSSAR